MRLICPNCGAQYEVEDGVIPQDGRDVQCSNCGHTWFESPDAPSAEAEEDSPAQAAQPMPPAMPAPQTRPEPQPEPEPRPEPQPAPRPAPQPAAAATPRPPLDSSIAEILREEAAREEAARRAETDDGLQSQGDLGLTDPAPAPRAKAAPPRRPDPAATVAEEGQQRLDRLRGSPAGPAPVTGARSEMFPDIEEINSSLRSSADRGPMAMLPAEEEASNRRSGRIGFFGTLILIGGLIAIYVYAGQIAQAVPALGDLLASYVATVDQARLWLDEKVQSLLPAASET